MTVDIHNLIAAISPDPFCHWSVADEVKKIVATGNGIKRYLDAAKVAKPADTAYTDIPNTRMSRSAFALEGFRRPTEKHKFTYDAASQNLEPVYFWIIEYVEREYKKATKLVDNFLASPGSGHFSELQQKATRMQDEAMKIFGTANTVMRSIINILYDLKEMKLRIAPYDDIKSEDKNKKMASTLSLKQIWLDMVDAKRGNSSIKGLAISGANQPNFVTLIDAFFAANSLDDIIKEPKDGGLDLNYRVKRILEQRYPEFERWIIQSEKELKTRMQIEKTYLRSQVSSAKLYARGMKPYLKAAKDLEQRAEANAWLVNAFNTVLFELSVLGTKEYDYELDMRDGELPKSFKIELERQRRSIIVVIVELKFKSVPDRSAQAGGYGYRGRSELTFTSYALTEPEMKVLQIALEEDDFGDLMSVIGGATDDSLATLQDDIDEFLSDEPYKDKKKEEKKESEDSNPFSGLFSFLNFSKEDTKTKDKYYIAPDTDVEKVMRSQVILDARWRCRKFYNAFKKSYDIPAFAPATYWYEEPFETTLLK